MNYMILAAMIYIIFVLLAIFIAKGFLLSPNTVFSVSFLGLLLLTCWYKDYFDYELKFNTFILLIGGGIAFQIADVIACTKFSVKKRLPLKENCFEKPKKIKLGVLTDNLILLSVIVILLVSIFTVYMNTNGSFTQRMVMYKNMQRTGVYIQYRQINKLALWTGEAIATVVSYIAAYNIIKAKTAWVKEIKHFIIILFFMIASAVGYGARQTAIEMIIIFLLFVFVLLFQSRKTTGIPKCIKNNIIKIAVLLFVMVNVFYHSAGLIGRQIAKTSALRYVANYFCGGLYYLNVKIDHPLSGQYFGEYSFSDLYSFLANHLGMFTDAVSSYKPFEKYGNTVTIFGDWFFDFGIIGAIIMAFIVCFICSCYFYGKIYCPLPRNLHVNNMIYCKILLAFVWAGYDDRIRALLSTKTLYIFFMIILLCKVIVEHRIYLKVNGRITIRL